MRRKAPGTLTPEPRPRSVARPAAGTDNPPPFGVGPRRACRRPGGLRLTVRGPRVSARDPRSARPAARFATGLASSLESPFMVVKKVGVIGCGLMGHGIAQISAQAGLSVVVRESDQAALDKGLQRIKRSLDKLVEKEKVSRADADAAVGRIKGSLRLEDLGDCDLVIEAIVENLDAKKQLFEQLDGLCKPTTIFASNTSSFSIGEMGTAS